MYLTSLPFEYTVHLGSGDRVRRKPGGSADTRVRRSAGRATSR